LIEKAGCDLAGIRFRGFRSMGGGSAFISATLGMDFGGFGANSCAIIASISGANQSGYTVTWNVPFSFVNVLFDSRSWSGWASLKWFITFFPICERCFSDTVSNGKIIALMRSNNVVIGGKKKGFRSSVAAENPKPLYVETLK
jgi:hypothetical protein